ncbi:MAG TPA: T9SS type A sorting domain-containing protein, partial [Chitinophagales bacterium]|nr:T9SS type A sorting domain-containing protein [Chitinophagales bacterium]
LVFPNPVFDIVTINWEHEIPMEQLQIVNIAGQNVTDHISIEEQSLGKTIIDMRNLSAGMYMIVIKTADGEAYGNCIKQ